VQGSWPSTPSWPGDPRAVALRAMAKGATSLLRRARAPAALLLARQGLPHRRPSSMPAGRGLPRRPRRGPHIGRRGRVGPRLDASGHAA
jgi:hypothetical protein